MPSTDSMKLSSNVTVAKYCQLENEQDKVGISKFVRERFTERYITPLRRDEKDKKNGFCTMAICCLMIESLESFRQGRANSDGRSGAAFHDFFKRNPPLSAFSEHSRSFYKNIRCGILHQAETTGGWCIRRSGVLFNANAKTINATKFHDALEQCLADYCDNLIEAQWSDEIWKNLRRKMKAICTNCSP